jgi:hypothetical protein
MKKIDDYKAGERKTEAKEKPGIRKHKISFSISISPIYHFRLNLLVKGQWKF